MTSPDFTVGFVLLHPFSDSLASAARVLNLAKGLAARNVSCKVFTPYETSKRLADGIEVVQIPSRLGNHFSSSGALYKLTRSLYYSRRLQKMMLSSVDKGVRLFDLKGVLDKNKVDILQAEQDNAALLCAPLAKRLHLPLVIDLHGIWSEELVASGVMSYESDEFKRTQRTLAGLFGSADLIFSLGEQMSQYVLNNYDVQPSRLVQAPPGAWPREIDYSARLGKHRVVCAGTVTHRKNVGLYVRSAPVVQRRIPDTECYLTNKGDLLSATKKLAERVSADIRYYWIKDEEELFGFLGGFNVGVVPASEDVATKLSMPSKLFDYWSVGVPVVANDVGGWTNLIADNGAGLVTEGVPEAFARGICQLLEDPEASTAMGAAGRRLVEREYNWDRISQRVFESLLRLL